MAEFGTSGDRGLRPEENTQTAVADMPKLDVGEIARDYSERGKAVENAVGLVDKIAKIHAQNVYNAHAQVIRKNLQTAVQGITNDPAQYASAPDRYNALLVQTRQGINDLGVSRGVTQMLQQDVSGEDLKYSGDISAFYHTNFIRDTTDTADSAWKQTVDSTAGSGPQSLAYKVAQDSILPKTYKGLVTAGALTPGQLATTYDTAKQKLALGDIGVRLRSDPAAVLADLGKSPSDGNKYTALSAPQWSAAYKAAQSAQQEVVDQQSGQTERAMTVYATNLGLGAPRNPVMEKSLLAAAGNNQNLRLRLQDTLNTGVIVAKVNADTKDQTLPELEQKLQSVTAATKPGANSPEALEYLNQLSARVNAFQTWAANDPQGFAGHTDEYQAAMAQAGNPDPTTAKGAQASVQALQVVYAHNHIQGPLLPTGYVANLRAQYTDPTHGENAQTLLNTLPQFWGKDWPAVAGEIFKKDGSGLPLSAMTIDPRASAATFAVQRNLDAFSVKDLWAAGAEQPVPITKTDVSQSLGKLFPPYAEALGPASDRYSEQLTKATLYYATQGAHPMSVDDASQAAVRLLFGNYKPVGGTLYPADMPLDHQPGSFYSVADAQKYFANVLATAPIKFAPGANEAMLRQQLMAAGGSSWLAHPDTQNFTLINGDGQAVMDANGRPITVDMNAIRNNIPYDVEAAHDALHPSATETLAPGSQLEKNAPLKQEAKTGRGLRAELPKIVKRKPVTP